MKIAFLILWGISVIICLGFAIKTVIEIKKDGEYMKYCIRMNIASIFMWLFLILSKIVK